MKWTTLEESFPSEKEQMLLLNVNNETIISFYFPGKKPAFYDRIKMVPIWEGITHWMPIPKYNDINTESHIIPVKLKIDVDLYNELIKHSNNADLSLSSYINAVLMDHIEMELDITAVHDLGKDNEPQQT